LPPRSICSRVPPSRRRLALAKCACPGHPTVAHPPTGESRAVAGYPGPGGNRWRTQIPALILAPPGPVGDSPDWAARRHGGDLADAVVSTPAASKPVRREISSDSGGAERGRVTMMGKSGQTNTQNIRNAQDWASQPAVRRPWREQDVVPASSRSARPVLEPLRGVQNAHDALTARTVSVA
jgi:hypothetical protein